METEFFVGGVLYASACVGVYLGTKAALGLYDRRCRNRMRTAAIQRWVGESYRVWATRESEKGIKWAAHAVQAANCVLRLHDPYPMEEAHGDAVKEAQHHLQLALQSAGESGDLEGVAIVEKLQRDLKLIPDSCQPNSTSRAG